jgi:hypothetical protein
MSTRLAVVAVALLVLGLSPPRLDLEMAPTPYVVTSRFGWSFFKMSPDPSDPMDRDKGIGFAYKAAVGQADELLWQTSGWYAFTVFLDDSGKYLVRLGNSPRGDKPSAADLAVAFYESGKLVKSYSTADLVKDASKVLASVSHYAWLGEPAPDFSAQPTMLAENLEFRLRTTDGIEYVFDARTGAVISAEKR